MASVVVSMAVDCNSTAINADKMPSVYRSVTSVGSSKKAATDSAALIIKANHPEWSTRHPALVS